MIDALYQFSINPIGKMAGNGIPENYPYIKNNIGLRYGNLTLNELDEIINTLSKEIEFLYSHIDTQFDDIMFAVKTGMENEFEKSSLIEKLKQDFLNKLQNSDDKIKNFVYFLSKKKAKYFNLDDYKNEFSTEFNIDPPEDIDLIRIGFFYHLLWIKWNGTEEKVERVFPKYCIDQANFTIFIEESLPIPEESLEAPKAEIDEVELPEKIAFPEKKSELKVFLSYSEKDFNEFQIEEISARLSGKTRVAHVFYWDNEKASWYSINEYEESAISDSDFIVVFFSENSKTSDGVRNEIHKAKESNKPIIPIFFNKEDIWDEELNGAGVIGIQFIEDNLIKFIEQLYLKLISIKRGNY